MEQISLTKHEKKTFDSQTIHISGQAFVNCVFKNCTLIVTNVAMVLHSCAFDKCNWSLDYQILWGAPETRKILRQLLDLIDGKSDKVDIKGLH